MFAKCTGFQKLSTIKSSLLSISRTPVLTYLLKVLLVEIIFGSPTSKYAWFICEGKLTITTNNQLANTWTTIVNHYDYYSPIPYMIALCYKFLHDSPYKKDYTSSALLHSSTRRLRKEKSKFNFFSPISYQWRWKML